jgi:signal transduction histidine kinase
MTERVHMLGGQITLSSDAAGSSVQITIPVDESHLDEWSADESLPA